jgi:hypothetical protein
VSELVIHQYRVMRQQSSSRARRSCEAILDLDYVHTAISALVRHLCVTKT